MRRGVALALGLTLVTGAALAQPYRWIDDKGRVQYTDTPPPKTAKDVRKQAAPQGPPAGSGVVPYELQVAQRDYPVTLYTATACKEACAAARNALNARAVPFKEIQVHDEASGEVLKKISGSLEVPVMTVGSTVQKGFEQSAFDAALDAARYPRAGLLPPGRQGPPPPPEQPAAPKPAAPPVKAEAPEQRPLGPYAPGATTTAAPAAKPAAKPQ